MNFVLSFNKTHYICTRGYSESIRPLPMTKFWPLERLSFWWILVRAQIAYSNQRCLKPCVKRFCKLIYYRPKTAIVDDNMGEVHQVVLNNRQLKNQDSHIKNGGCCVESGLTKNMFFWTFLTIPWIVIEISYMIIFKISKPLQKCTRFFTSWR